LKRTWDDGKRPKKREGENFFGKLKKRSNGWMFQVEKYGWRKSKETEKNSRDEK